MDRRTVSNGIDWTVYNVMQYIMDLVYTQENILTYETLLDGFKFRSSAHFPGAVDPPDDKDESYTVKINGSYLKTYGHLTMHAERHARKPTGAYLAPGTIATLTVPSSLVGKGYQIRVGAHSWDMSNRPMVKRLDRSSLVYDINSTEIKVANPLGGGIYIEVPYLADAGIVDVKIKNAVRSPYFSMKSFHSTSLSEWQNTESKHKAPWADFQSDKFMMQVPTSWIYNLQDPVTLMENWDHAMDATNDLMGYPHIRGKETMYPQVDVIFRVPYHAPGYPSINVTNDPSRDYGGYHDYHLVTGPQKAKYYEFHEQGHAYLFTKFPGEVESNVNLLHVAVWHQKFGYSLDEAFRNSMDKDIEYRTLDHTAVCWMMCQNFKEKKPMEKLEKQYQLKGHAKFVEIARLFGWEVLGGYWKSFNEDYENGLSSDTDIDKLLLRLSRSVGVDITPLFHFWGVQPVKADDVKTGIISENLPASAKVYDTLVKYKSLVPEEKTNYQDFALSWWGHQPDSDGYMTEKDHAMLWSTYNED
ncbi:MAG: M60 family metallopeptidase, partial [Bacteroidales bacterium]|nr:M60 family metallopeptidase [Bacteroidales bacterium]